MTLWQFQAAFDGFKDFNISPDDPNAPRGDPSEAEYEAMMERFGFNT